MNETNKKTAEKAFFTTKSFWLFLGEIPAAAVAALTFSIGVPIYFRPFYYFCVRLFKIEETSGYSSEVILDAYQKLMDYLLFGKEFSTGALLYSAEGKAHFEDCKVLFDLDRNAFLISMTVLIALIGIRQLTKTPAFYVKDRFGVGFFAGILAVALPAVFGIYAMTDFNRAFVLFHKVFFPGKSNWMFNPYTDQIINVLPEEFFAACGALIGIVLLILSVIMIVTGIRKGRRKVVE